MQGQLNNSEQMEPKLFGIPRENITHWWSSISSLMDAACKRSGDRYLASDLLELLTEGKMQLWLVLEGSHISTAVITEIVNYPRLKQCTIIACVGSGMERWVHLILVIEEWAMENGCRKILAISRLGWKRVLSDYKHTHEYLEKDLGNVH